MTFFVDITLLTRVWREIYCTSMATIREDDEDLDPVQLLIIQEVEKFPELYDKSHAKYKKRIHKVQLWAKIAKDLNIAGMFVVSVRSRLYINLLNRDIMT